MTIMLNKIENLSHKIVKKLDLGDRQMRKLMKPEEVFLTNAPTELSEIESGLVESYKSDYDSVRIIPTAFSILGRPLPGYAAIVGIPKKTPVSK